MNKFRFVALVIAAVVSILPALALATYAYAQTYNYSQCNPLICSQSGYQCGSWNDGCNGTIYCGSCGYNQTCQNGSCSPNCSDQCSQGERRCSSNGYQVCGRYDGNNCDSYGPMTYCGSDQECDNGNCVNRNYDYNNTAKQLKVALYSDPTTGCAPLNGVSLRALVSNADVSGYGNYNNSGSAGGLTYSFDCDNNGTFEKTVVSSEAEVVVNSLCNYSASGNYTARVRVADAGQWATDTAIIKVNSCQNYVIPPVVYVQPIQPIQNSGSLSVQKMVANLSSGTQYQTAVSANPGDFVSFKITVNSGNGLAKALIVSDNILSRITNIRDLRVDGQIIAGNILAGLNIGDLNPNQQRVIIFTATVAGNSNFPYGQSTLTDTATVRDDSMSNSSTATVYVWRQAVLGATSVSTGIMDSDWTNYLAAGIAALLAATWLFSDKLAALLVWLKTKINLATPKI